MDRRVLALGATGALALLLSVGALLSWTRDGNDEPAQRATVDPVERGRALFQTEGCVGCHHHMDAGGQSIGPDLTFLHERASEQVEGMTAGEYVRVSILSPDAYVVPGYGSAMPRLPVTGDEVDALVAFLLAER